MKYSVDGNRLCVTRDDFVNLQESPAVFIPLDDPVAKTILKNESIRSISLYDLVRIKALLETGGGYYPRPEE